jgi:hypothetical protein
METFNVTRPTLSNCSGFVWQVSLYEERFWQHSAIFQFSKVNKTIVKRSFKNYIDQMTEHVISATKYLRNLNQYQSYLSVKENADESIICAGLL